MESLHRWCRPRQSRETLPRGKGVKLVPVSSHAEAGAASSIADVWPWYPVSPGVTVAASGDGYHEGETMAPNGSERVTTEALRLVLTYRAGDVVLDEVMFVAKRLPPSDDLPEVGPEGALSGFWYELQDEAGEVLYRQIIGNPIISGWVVPSEEPEEGPGLSRLEAIPETKTFALLIPYMPEGRHVVLFSTPLEAAGVALPAEPQWRVELPPPEHE